jgi:hypothetical protein
MVGDCAIEPQTQCPGANLNLVSLRGMDLSGANLSGASITASDLVRTDLTGANLTDANLSDSDLTRAKLVGADLTGAVLKHANLALTDLTGATLRTAQLTNARLCGTILPDGTKDDTGCIFSPSPPASPSTSSPTLPPPPNNAVITKFVVPDSAVCPSSPPDAVVTVKIQFATQNATSVEFLIDGVAPGAGAGYGTKGTATLDFSCKEPQHKYAIVASGEGKPAKQSAVVFRA